MAIVFKHCTLLVYILNFLEETLPEGTAIKAKCYKYFLPKKII